MAETRRIEQQLPPDISPREPEPELPPARRRANPRLNEAAQAIGGALGNATRQVQNVRDRLTVIPGGPQGGHATAEQLKQAAQEKLQTARERVEELKERAETAVATARIRASAGLDEARAKASNLMLSARRSAAERARLVRWRAVRLTEERPIAVLAAIAGAAFLLGLFLRLGRGKRG